MKKVAYCLPLGFSSSEVSARGGPGAGEFFGILITVGVLYLIFCVVVYCIERSSSGEIIKAILGLLLWFSPSLIAFQSGYENLGFILMAILAVPFYLQWKGLKDKVSKSAPPKG